MTTPPPESQGHWQITWGTIWTAFRLISGWICILVGLVLFPLPLPLGLPLIILGILLVGTRNIMLRWLRVHMKILLRRWAALSTPIIGPLGKWLLKTQKAAARRWRHYLRQSAARHRIRTLP
jgi:hypothetical protein